MYVTIYSANHTQDMSNYANTSNFSMLYNGTNEEVSKEYFDYLFVFSEEPVYIEIIDTSTSNGISPVDVLKVWVIDIDTSK